MRLRDLFSRAKRTVDDRGGVDSLKQDAAELKDIARGEGSVSEKAKRAADAVKDPGARRREGAPSPETPGSAEPASGATSPDPPRGPANEGQTAPTSPQPPAGPTGP